MDKEQINKFLEKKPNWFQDIMGMSPSECRQYEQKMLQEDREERRRELEQRREEHKKDLNKAILKERERKNGQ